jgi:hypothetical protein
MNNKHDPDVQKLFFNKQKGKNPNATSCLSYYRKWFSIDKKNVFLLKSYGTLLFHSWHCNIPTVTLKKNSSSISTFIRIQMYRTIWIYLKIVIDNLTWMWHCRQTSLLEKHWLSPDTKWASRLSPKWISSPALSVPSRKGTPSSNFLKSAIRGW